MSSVLVAVVGGVFGIATIVIQARVHRDNRNDHADTAHHVRKLIGSVESLSETSVEIKQDVRDVKADLRDHHARLRLIETEARDAPPTTKDEDEA